MAQDAMDRFKSVSHDLLGALGERAVSTATEKVGDLSGRLEDVAGGGPVGQLLTRGGEAAAEGKSPVGGALKGAVGGVKDKVTDKITGGGKGKGKGGRATKATTILEEIDVGVPISVAYNQWTEFGGFPSFMKKVESVQADEDNKLRWKAQIFWSHREWTATIREQIPEERIVWRSEGQKGHVDGAVTFHEIGPELTRIIVVLEYYPQGFMERTGNIWRAQGRRVRAELLHFRRHIMTRTILQPDELEGWRGRIEDGEVVESHEDAMARQEEESGEDEGSEEQPEDEGSEEQPEDEESEEEPEDEYEEEPEDEESEEEPEDEESEGEPEDEYEEEPEDKESEEEPEDEADEGEADEGEDSEEEPEEEPKPKRGRRR